MNDQPKTPPITEVVIEEAHCPRTEDHIPHMWTWREEGVHCPGEPECRSPLGCDKVVPCDPGCAVSSRYIAEQLAAANARAHNAKAMLGTPATHQPRTFPDVQGRCPECGWTTLFLADGGYVTCSRIDCPDPCAATDLLDRDPRTTPNNSPTSNDTANNSGPVSPPSCTRRSSPQSATR